MASRARSHMRVMRKKYGTPLIFFVSCVIQSDNTQRLGQIIFMPGISEYFAFCWLLRTTINWDA